MQDPGNAPPPPSPTPSSPVRGFQFILPHHPQLADQETEAQNWRVGGEIGSGPRPPGSTRGNWKVWSLLWSLNSSKQGPTGDSQEARPAWPEKQLCEAWDGTRPGAPRAAGEGKPDRAPRSHAQACQGPGGPDSPPEVPGQSWIASPGLHAALERGPLTVLVGPVFFPAARPPSPLFFFLSFSFSPWRP